MSTITIILSNRSCGNIQPITFVVYGNEKYKHYQSRRPPGYKMSADRDVSIVEYRAEHEGYACGYCKSTSTNYSHGMWAHILTVEDYQDLIDRGWRRSGMYCYKPTMDLTCCPAYTIRCDALEFKLSKSQKNVIKKMNKYLITGETKPNKPFNPSSNDDTETSFGSNILEFQAQSKSAEDKLLFKDFALPINKDTEFAESLEVRNSGSSINLCNVDAQVKPTQSSFKVENVPKPGQGPDPKKPPCKKAKLLRQERREQKCKKESINSQNPSALKQNMNCSKTIEDHLKIPLENVVHKLEIRLVRSHPKSSEFKTTLSQSHEIYSKYQQTVHNDPSSKCTFDQYVRFLVNSPLAIKLLRSNPPCNEYQNNREKSILLYQKYQMEVHNDSEVECDEDSYTSFLENSPLVPKTPSDGPNDGYGSFHQQYWLDEKLIAVGVIDILPYCISSVYFFYDPDYRFLSLGTYASLQEIAFTRELEKQNSNLKYYYMGFYIHSCPKMRYKGQYNPSFLLCPEVYSWHFIEDCKKKLDQSKYSRLNEDSNKVDENTIDVEQVSLLHQRVAMPFSIYKRRKHGKHVDEEEVVQYAKLVGGSCARRILLYRR